VLYYKHFFLFKLFLAFVLSSFNAGVVLAGPLFGLFVDWFGHQRKIFLFTCCIKVLSYILYSINISGFFPLSGRLLSGIAYGGMTAITFGQIALQTEPEERGGIYVFIEGVYCLGATTGPAVGGFIAFDITIWGWHINQGNSPGILLTMVWTLFLIVTILLPKDVWLETGLGKKEVSFVEQVEEKREIIVDTDGGRFTKGDPNGKRKLAEVHPNGDGSLNDVSLPRGQDLFDCSENSDEKMDVYTFNSEDELIEPSGRPGLPNFDLEGEANIECNSAVLCLLYLTFISEFFSSTSTFYVPVIALHHFHLQLIHVKLLFLNCAAFTFLVFILFTLASNYINERKLFLVALSMQIAAILVLTSIGFAWDRVTNAQNYILLLYICLGMPYFAYPFSNSILSKITDPRNASFYQGSSISSVHLAIVSSRVIISFVKTKESLIIYCFSLVFLWFTGFIWFGLNYKRFVGKDEKHK
jgi:MFS family permease